MSGENGVSAQGWWPSGCHDPDSCARHQRCMYVQCHRNGRAIAPGEIKEALSRSGNNDGSAKPVLPGPSETLNPRQGGTHNGDAPQETRREKELRNLVLDLWKFFAEDENGQLDKWLALKARVEKSQRGDGE